MKIALQKLNIRDLQILYINIFGIDALNETLEKDFNKQDYIYDIEEKLKNANKDNN